MIGFNYIALICSLAVGGAGAAAAAGVSCSDSDYWAKNGETCAWVAEDADDRCSLEGDERVAVACARACGPNDNDFHDSLTFSFKHKKKQRDCSWLAKKKWKRMWGRLCGWHKNKKGADLASTACAEACGACDGGAPTTTTASPTPKPTASPTTCLLYTSPSPRDQRGSRMPSSA